MIRVLLADDQNLVRAGFRALLERAPDIEVVGEAADGAEAVRLAWAHRPDVVLMDVRMPGTDGLTATRRILAEDRLPGVRVLVLTTYDLDEYVFAALRAEPAVSCSRTSSRTRCGRPCGSSPRGTPCWRRR
ncbi:hypothetical protein GCM10027605_23120 [Micromonospora zhanjiangensis]